MAYKAIIWDLDGTLLDTTGDIQEAVNHCLKEYGFPSRSKQEIQSFLGNGKKVLIQKATGLDENDSKLEQMVSAYQSLYNKSEHLNTIDYDGIYTLIATLKQRAYHLAVLSNKEDYLVKQLINHFFPSTFDWVQGETEGIERKPDPSGVYKLLNELELDSKDCLYIGDSEVDYQTAMNSKLDCVLVSWGFRGRTYLEKLNPLAILDHPLELIDILERNDV